MFPLYSGPNVADKFQIRFIMRLPYTFIRDTHVGTASVAEDKKGGKSWWYRHGRKKTGFIFSSLRSFLRDKSGSKILTVITILQKAQGVTNIKSRFTLWHPPRSCPTGQTFWTIPSGMRRHKASFCDGGCLQPNQNTPQRGKNAPNTIGW